MKQSAAVAMLMVTLTSCTAREELTCRWVLSGRGDENLRGPDPVIRMTSPWSDLGLPMDHATICVSDPDKFCVLYKNRGNPKDGERELVEALRAHGRVYAGDRLGSWNGHVETKKGSFAFSTRIWPDVSWKGSPYSIQFSPYTG